MNLVNVRQQIYAIGATVSGSHGFYYGVAPDDVTYPYIVYHLIDDYNERIAVGAHTDSILIQFNIIDRRVGTLGKKISSADIEGVANELITKLNAATINVQNFGTLYMKRTLMTPSMLIEDGSYWQLVVRYELYLTNQ